MNELLAKNKKGRMGICSGCRKTEDEINMRLYLTRIKLFVCTNNSNCFIYLTQLCTK